MATTARIVAVAPGSPAEHAGLAPGDELLTLNGEGLRDVIRYQFLVDEAELEIEIRRGGLEQTVRVAKSAGEPLGAELESAVFDRVQTCDNHCPFCFIYQLPKGMRRSLYLKDDDYRLSFLYGNFTTLTRFTEADLERVVDERLGPLYVSIHATDPEVRARMLRNRRGATSLRWLRLLLDHRVEVHGQVVVCPEVNDGEVLHDTFLGVLDRFPELASLGVVPVGVSAHNTDETVRPMTSNEAGAVLDAVHTWQQRFLRALGRRVVFAADELYLMADVPFPSLETYEGLAQHENGIGMTRALEHDVRRRLAGGDVRPVGPRDGFFAWVEGRDPRPGPRASADPEGGTTPCAAPPGWWSEIEGAPADGYRAERTGQPVTLRARPGAPVVIVTGEYGARVLEPLLPELADHARGPVRILAVSNRFFGGNIAVTGLLTGRDVAAVLSDQPATHRYLLPDVVLSKDRFLDGSSLADLPREVEVVPTNGVALVDALQPRGPALRP